MKRMLKLQTADNNYCLQSYKKHLEELAKNAGEGKDPHCTKCDEFGFVKGSKNLVPVMCHCVSDEKIRINRKIEALEAKIKRYNDVFDKLDNDMTLDIFAERFNQTDLINSIKKYLNLGSINSLYIFGESASGKTTMLKMLWQIYAVNNIKALYIKASSFEDMHKNLFNKNAQDRDLKSSIDAKIANIRFADIIMIDDIDSVGFHYASEGYYKLFDKIRASEKTAILTSNKSFSSLMDSLSIKSRKDNIEEIKGRIASRLLGLNIIEIEMQKSKELITS